MTNEFMKTIDKVPWNQWDLETCIEYVRIANEVHDNAYTYPQIEARIEELKKNQKFYKALEEVPWNQWDLETCLEYVRLGRIIGFCADIECTEIESRISKLVN